MSCREYRDRIGELATSGETPAHFESCTECAGMLRRARRIAGSIVSLIATPFLIRLGPRLGDWVAADRGSDVRQNHPADAGTTAGVGPTGRTAVVYPVGANLFFEMPSYLSCLHDSSSGTSD